MLVIICHGIVDDLASRIIFMLFAVECMADILALAQLGSV